MKAYKEKKANEPEPADASSPEAAKPSKKSSVKELFAKKADKKKGGSPRKSAGSEAQKFKSAEFVDTDDSSSEDEGKVSCLYVLVMSCHHSLVCRDCYCFILVYT